MDTRTQKRQRDLEAESDELVAKTQKSWNAFLDARARNVKHDVSTQAYTTNLSKEIECEVTRLRTSNAELERRTSELECELTRYRISNAKLEVECKQLRRKVAIAGACGDAFNEIFQNYVA